MQGRMLEVPIVITLGLAGIAWLTAVSPRLDQLGEALGEDRVRDARATLG